MLGVVVISVGVIALGGAGTPTGAYMATLLGVLVLTLCSLGCFASLRESYLLSMSVSIKYPLRVLLDTFLLIYHLILSNLVRWFGCI